MTVEFFTSFLAWCTLVNLVFLLIWVFFLTVGGSWKRMHGKWFKMSDEDLSAVHYKMLAYFKLLWVMFNLTPYLVLRLFL